MRRKYKSVKAARCVILSAYSQDGPVAQLGARFHGMEEVESSNLSRSTKILKRSPHGIYSNGA